METDHNSCFYIQTEDGESIPVCSMNMSEISLSFDSGNEVVESAPFSFTVKYNRRKYRDALARLCGYHNYTHMKRPRMKRRWERKK